MLFQQEEKTYLYLPHDVLCEIKKRGDTAHVLCQIIKRLTGSDISVINNKLLLPDVQSCVKTTHLPLSDDAFTYS